MIEVLVRKFDLIERDVNLLTRALIFLMFLIFCRAAYFLFAKDFEGIWNLLGPLTPVAAALLVSRVASRSIVHGQIQREDDRRREIVQVTHNLLAVTKDLKSRIEYFNKLMADGDRPVAVIVNLAKSIEKRYETLFEKDAYQYLPGKSIDLINSLSGSIYGILTTAEILETKAVASSLAAIGLLTGKTSSDYIANIQKVESEIQTLIDQIFEVRNAVDAPTDRKIFKICWMSKAAKPC